MSCSIEDLFRRTLTISILGPNAQPVVPPSPADTGAIPEDDGGDRESFARTNNAAADAVAAPEIPVLQDEAGEPTSPSRARKRLSFTLPPCASRKKAKMDD